MQVKKNESGSIMVEVIAVLALLGLMGTVMFRQMQRRNEELDNINMASEIRMVKEATTAYIQANKATLEANCTLGPDGYGYQTISHENVDRFMPDNWACDSGSTDCIVYDYQIYLTCYQIDSALAGNRIAMYGMIIPNAGEYGPMPPNFNLRRAARVATLIGSDGGVHEASSETLQGTMGAWEVDCPSDANCDDRTDDFFVATTGMDVYIPETENTADNTVAVPHNIAFERLHGTDYFSVGGSGNCVGGMTGSQFPHETLDPATGRAVDDEILNPGVGGSPACDPLFWVGTGTGDATYDHSAGNQVYVKNNLYVGRDNASNRQAVSLEKGTGAEDNKIVVYDETGKERLTLNGAGKIIGRTNDATGRGYRIDDDGVTLFEEKEVTIGADTRKVQVPTIRLTGNRLETNVIAKYYDGDTLKEDQVYAVDPAGTSLMNDIRLTTRGGAKLSEILPNYIAKEVKTVAQSAAETKPSVKKPECPRGYMRAIAVTPTKYSQYVTQAEVKLNNLKGNTNEATAAMTHKHSVTIANQLLNATALNNANGVLSGSGSDGTLTLKQLPPVKVEITTGTGGDADKWFVGFKYGADDSLLSTHPVTALAQTYCVFDADNFGDESADININGDGMAKERKKEGGIIQDGERSCASNGDCLSTERCSKEGKCVKMEPCSETDMTPLGNRIYCVDGVRIYLECTDDTVAKDCGPGKNCSTNFECVDSGS